MPRLVVALISLIVVFSSACSDAEDVHDQGGEDPSPAPVEEATWNRCTNPAAGYTVEYPAEWHTNTGGQVDECRVFDPQPISLPDEPQDLPLDFGVLIRVEPIAFADLTSADTAVQITDTQELEVDGHRAVRQELVATGTALVPEGTESTRYAVDRNGETLVAESFALGEPPYERKVQVLSEMVSSLDFPEES